MTLIPLRSADQYAAAGVADQYDRRLSDARFDRLSGRRRDKVSAPDATETSRVQLIAHEMQSKYRWSERW